MDSYDAPLSDAERSIADQLNDGTVMGEAEAQLRQAWGNERYDYLMETETEFRSANLHQIRVTNGALFGLAKQREATALFVRVACGCLIAATVKYLVS